MPSLKLNGKPLAPSNKQRIQQTIAQIPAGHLLSTNELAAKANVHPNDAAMRHPELNQHKRKHNNALVWGGQKTIAAYDKQMNEGN